MGIISPKVSGDNIDLGDAELSHENVTHDPVYLSGQTGLDDLSSSGTYSLTGNAAFQIRIQATGTPDSFEWRKGTSGSWTGPVAVTGGAQLLGDGISITWAATTGHTLNDEWEMNVGHEVHLSEALHVNDDITADGDIIVVGSLRSLSPVRIAGGLKLLCDATIETDCATMDFKLGGVNRFNLENDGTIAALTTNYETLVTSDNDIPNKKYVDDCVGDISTDEIVDADGDTKIQVEESADDDIIRFDTTGVQRLMIQNALMTSTVPLLVITGTNVPFAPVRSASGQWITFNDGTDLFGLYNRAGTPEGFITADIGSFCTDTTNGDLYIKTTDTVNTGWLKLADASHTVASHSDTTATGAELDTLTDNSIANTLHRHSELVASDGSPDPALSIDASGNVGINHGAPVTKLHIETNTTDDGILLRRTAGVGAELARLSADGTGPDGQLQLYDSGTPTIRLRGNPSQGPSYFWHWDQAVRVGFGTATPSATVDIEGTLQYVDGNEGVDKILTSDASGNATWQVNPAASSEAGTAIGQMTFWNNTASRWDHTETSELIWDDINKRLGVGKAAPGAKFQVVGDAIIGLEVGSYTSSNALANVLNALSPTESTVGDFAPIGTLRLRRAGTSGTKWGQSVDFFLGGYDNNINSHSQLDIKMTEANTATPDMTVMSMRSNGNVGIGTTTPDEKLHVAGNIKMVDGNEEVGAVLTSDVNGVGSWEVPEFAEEIAGTTDFSTMKTSGHFRSNNSGAPVNGGDAVWGWYLKVEVSAEAAGRIYQRHMSHTTGTVKEYTRRTDNDGTTWTPWVGVGTSEAGDAPGQMLFWNTASNKWLHTEDTELKFNTFTKDLEIGSGSLIINQGADDDEIISLKSSDVSHGMTGIAEADTYGSLKKTYGLYGGLNVSGMSEGNYTALMLNGFIGSNNPSDTMSAIILRAQKYDGATGSDPLGNAETVFKVQNEFTDLFNILGGGNVGIGTPAPYGVLDVVGNILTSMHNNASQHHVTEQGKNYIGHKSGSAAMTAGFTGMQVDIGPYGAGGVNSGSRIHFMTWANSIGASRELVTINEYGNVGIGTTSPAAKLEVNGYTMLGSDAPVIKMKKITGTTGASEGSATPIAHGLPDRSKILGAQVLVTQSGGNRIPPAFTSIGEHEYDFFIDATNVNVRLSATNSNSIRSGAITVLLTYEE